MREGYGGMREGYGGVRKRKITSLFGISPSIQQQLHYLDVVLLRRIVEWGSTVVVSLMRWTGKIGGWGWG